MLHLWHNPLFIFHIHIQCCYILRHLLGFIILHCLPCIISLGEILKIWTVMWVSMTKPLFVTLIVIWLRCLLYFQVFKKSIRSSCLGTTHSTSNNPTSPTLLAQILSFIPNSIHDAFYETCSHIDVEWEQKLTSLSFLFSVIIYKVFFA
jgi:hypothetical protein